MSIWKRWARVVLKTGETTWAFSLLVAALFCAVLLYGHVHHECWRDEVHPWVMMRDTEGFWNIAFGDRIYEGHPPLWFWYLRAWSWVTRRVWGLHAATIAAEGTAILLFLRYAPFARALKVLLTFSYLLAFEYGVMSRNYTMGVLALFALAATFRTWRVRPIVYVMLGLLSLSSVYGLCMAIALFVVVAFRGSSVSGSDDAVGILTLRVPRATIWGSLFFALTVVFTYLSTNPPDANPYAPDWNLSALGTSAIDPALDRFVAALLPLRQLHDKHFWQAHVPLAAEMPTLFSWLRYLLPAACLLSLFPCWPEVIALLVGSFLITVIQAARYLGHIRHWGSFFLLYLALVWLARVARPRGRHWLSGTVLVIVGACQLQGFLVSMDKDRKYAFAGGPEVANRMKEKGLDKLPLVLGPDWAAPSITAYLDEPFVSVETEEISQTLIFHGRRVPFSAQALADKAAEVAARKHTRVAVVSTHPVPPPGAAVKSFDLVIQNDVQPLQGDEQFFVYVLTPVP